MKTNEYWRKRYNKELKQLFGDLDTLSFVKIRRLNCIDHVNRMDTTRKVSQVFNNNPQGSRLKGRQKADGGTVYKQILIDVKLKTVKRGMGKKYDWEKFVKKAKVHIAI